MMGGVRSSGSPTVTAAETVTAQELLNKIRPSLNVPQVPRGLIQRKL